MFPIPFNFPFRKKDGSLTTIDAAIAGGGTPYILPTASATVKGGVKVGDNLSIDGNGVLSASGGTSISYVDYTITAQTTQSVGNYVAIKNGTFPELTGKTLVNVISLTNHLQEPEFNKSPNIDYGELPQPFDGSEVFIMGRVAKLASESHPMKVRVLYY